MLNHKISNSINYCSFFFQVCFLQFNSINIFSLFIVGLLRLYSEQHVCYLDFVEFNICGSFYANMSQSP